MKIQWVFFSSFLESWNDTSSLQWEFAFKCGFNFWGKRSVSARLIFLELCWVAFWCSPIIYRKKKNTSDVAKSFLKIHFEEYVITDFNWLQVIILKRSNLSANTETECDGNVKISKQLKGLWEWEKVTFFVPEHTGNMAKYVNAYLVAQRGCAY